MSDGAAARSHTEVTLKNPLALSVFNKFICSLSELLPELWIGFQTFYIIKIFDIHFFSISSVFWSVRVPSRKLLLFRFFPPSGVRKWLWLKAGFKVNVGHSLRLPLPWRPGWRMDRLLRMSGSLSGYTGPSGFMDFAVQFLNVFSMRKGYTFVEVQRSSLKEGTFALCFYRM